MNKSCHALQIDLSLSSGAGEMAVLLPRIPLSVVGTVWREPTGGRRKGLLWIEPVQPECMTGVTSGVIPSVSQEEGLDILDSRTHIPG